MIFFIYVGRMFDQQAGDTVRQNFNSLIFLTRSILIYIHFFGVSFFQNQIPKVIEIKSVRLFCFFLNFNLIFNHNGSLIKYANISSIN